MYSPKIKEEFIPILFKISVSTRIPMTKLVNQIIKDYLEGNFQAKSEQKKVEEPK
jgi:ribose 5-phosphate isomerase RpiB